MKETIEVDLSKLIKRAGMIIAGENIELELIGLYKHKYNEDSKIVQKFTNMVLYKLYGDVRRYSTRDIYKFIPRNKYNAIVIEFIKSMEIMILNKIKPYPLDIVFNKYLIKTDNTIKAEFTITYLKDD